MNINKRIEFLRPTKSNERLGEDVYEVVKELNNKLEVLEDLVIELKNNIQQIQMIQKGEDVP